LLAGLYSLVQTRRLKRYERAVCRGADAVIAVSPEDAAALRALDPKLRVTVVPNGVDLAWYQPGDRRSDGATALFIGKLDYRPNLDAIEWLVDEIWPRVVRDEPRARLLIVGRDAPSRLDRVNRVAGVKLVGAVPDERPWFDQADVLVVPMRMGGGVRLKVVQAMAMGVPVVATPAGVAGLDLADGDHYLRGETGPALADQIVRLLRDPPLRQRLATNGRDRATASYDWRVILPGLDRAYADLAGVR
jgi:glycosyltransferase involved in cell wall biosynthesis